VFAGGGFGVGVERGAGGTPPVPPGGTKLAAGGVIVVGAPGTEGMEAGGTGADENMEPPNCARDICGSNKTTANNSAAKSRPLRAVVDLIPCMHVVLDRNRGDFKPLGRFVTRDRLC
jgi:hypothetical protein